MDRIKRGQLEMEENWDQFSRELPFLDFPKEWLVKITPAFGGAIVRFRVRTKETPKEEDVSVYFDAFDCLGYVGKPYWEIYPNEEGDCSRFLLGQEEDMINAISRSLENLE